LKGTSSTIARELKTINPATEEIIGQYEIMTKEQIDDKVKKAQSTFQVWKSSIDKRTDLL
jgi:acyl-CoA reductase-like NAD-dependent aldehyde dehydrogenase